MVPFKIWLLFYCSICIARIFFNIRYILQDHINLVMRVIINDLLRIHSICSELDTLQSDKMGPQGKFWLKFQTRQGIFRQNPDSQSATSLKSNLNIKILKQSILKQIHRDIFNKLSQTICLKSSYLGLLETLYLSKLRTKSGQRYQNFWEKFRTSLGKFSACPTQNKLSV